MDITLSIGEDGMALIFDYEKKFVVNCLIIINISMQWKIMWDEILEGI